MYEINVYIDLWRLEITVEDTLNSRTFVETRNYNPLFTLTKWFSGVKGLSQ